MRRLAAAGSPDSPATTGPRPLTVTGLLLLDPYGHDPTTIESITFDDSGIGVVARPGTAARVLPWDSVITHAVEPWAGGIIPGWWVHSEPDSTLRADIGADELATSTLDEHASRTRALPYVEAGALVSIQTSAGTYRFLQSGGDSPRLAGRIGEFAIHHQGPAGASAVTTVAQGRHRHARSDSRSTWHQVRPWLVGVLVVVIAAAVSLILLQSAGTIHLPFLGGGASIAVPIADSLGRPVLLLSGS